MLTTGPAWPSETRRSQSPGDRAGACAHKGPGGRRMDLQQIAALAEVSSEGSQYSGSRYQI